MPAEIHTEVIFKQSVALAKRVLKPTALLIIHTAIYYYIICIKSIISLNPRLMK